MLQISSAQRRELRAKAHALKPVVIIGDMNKSFLDLPPEVIKLSMRTHQKYFAVRDPSWHDGRLAPKFIVVANLVIPLFWPLAPS